MSPGQDHLPSVICPGLQRRATAELLGDAAPSPTRTLLMALVHGVSSGPTRGAHSLLASRVLSVPPGLPHSTSLFLPLPPARPGQGLALLSVWAFSFLKLWRAMLVVNLLPLLESLPVWEIPWDEKVPPTQ